MNAKTELATEAAQFKDKKRKLWMLGLVIPNIANVTMLGYQFGPKKTKKLFGCRRTTGVTWLNSLIR